MWHEGGAGITRGRCRCGMGGTGEVWQGQLWHGRGAGVPWEGCRYREGRPDPIRALIPYGCLTHTGATTAGAEVLISTTKSTKRANCPAKPPVSMTGLLLVNQVITWVLNVQIYVLKNVVGAVRVWEGRSEFEL